MPIRSGGERGWGIGGMEHSQIYAAPEVYEVAFSYRDVPEQCDFLAAVY